MSWAKRCLAYFQHSPRAMCAKDLEMKYCVPNAYRHIRTLLDAACILQDVHHAGRDRYFVAIPGAVAPDDRRADNARRLLPLCAEAKALKRSPHYNNVTAAPGMRQPLVKPRRVRA